MLAQWCDHTKYDSTRGYMRDARTLLRTYKPGPDLNQLLYAIRRI